MHFCYNSQRQSRHPRRVITRHQRNSTRVHCCDDLTPNPKRKVGQASADAARELAGTIPRGPRAAARDRKQVRQTFDVSVWSHGRDL